MALSYSIKSFGREPNLGRRFMVVEVVAGGVLGTFNTTVRHLNPNDPDFRKNLRAHIRALVQGMRQMRQLQNQQPGIPNLSPAEEAALIAAAPDDADQE